MMPYLAKFVSIVSSVFRINTLPPFPPLPSTLYDVPLDERLVKLGLSSSFLYVTMTSLLDVEIVEFLSEDISPLRIELLFMATGDLLPGGALTLWVVFDEREGGEGFGTGLLVFVDVMYGTVVDFVVTASCSSILFRRRVSFFMSSSCSLEEVWLFPVEAPPTNGLGNLPVCVVYVGLFALFRVEDVDAKGRLLTAAGSLTCGFRAGFFTATVADDAVTTVLSSLVLSSSVASLSLAS